MSHVCETSSRGRIRHSTGRSLVFFVAVWSMVLWSGAGVAEVGVPPMDAGVDVGSTDIGPQDTGSSTDATTADGGVSTDAEMADTSPDPTGPAVLDGRVTVKFAADNSMVEVALSPASGDWSKSQTTSASGDFQFDSIPTGEYQLSLSREGYVQVGRTLQVRGDRSLNVTMFPDQSVQLRAEARFDGDSPPETVSFGLEGERGTFSPEEPIPVEEGRAVWMRSDLPVGNWTLTAEADGYLEASYDLGVRAGDSEEAPAYRVHLQMVSQDREADTVSDGGGGCGCRDEDARGGGGGRIPGGFGPGALLLVGWFALRRFSHH